MMEAEAHVRSTQCCACVCACAPPGHGGEVFRPRPRASRFFVLIIHCFDALEENRAFFKKDTT